jgi:hypothetical protein
MKNVARVTAVVMVVLALTAGQSMLMAAPVQGSAVAVQHSGKLGLLDTFLRIFGAVWRVTDKSQIQGGGSTDAAVWGNGNCKTC